VRTVLDIPVAAVTPDRRSVLRAMGAPGDREPSEQVAAVLERALDEFRELARPRAIIGEVDTHAFARVYEGDGDNDGSAPLEDIFPLAERLTLFVVTLGAGLSDRIRPLFDEGELALGATLDAAASEGAELAAAELEREVDRRARMAGIAETSRSLRYSPGYCGWSITGQRALFSALGPEDIGVRLNDSCLMEPLKSVSGVVVTGPPDIHRFDDRFPCCSECRTRECRSRIAALDAAGQNED
jgi:hypothetical protein